ncbi:MAG: class I SAM-dependent methyltransferase [Victivallales bacterium]|nr:class I SAM-dependent methyltransferase [Victivallales bacterium]
MNKSEYWDNIVEQYQRESIIFSSDFHYGPLIDGDSVLKLLPRNIKNKNCLELACGGAQNSIYLAKKGANCTALDASAAQIAYAGKLAQKNAVQIDLQVMSMEQLNSQSGCFDLIHSAYGFNFAADLNKVIKTCGELLNKDGVLLFSMPHPLFSGEFLELDDESGLFIKEYFSISPDLRLDEDANETARSYFYSIDEISTVLAQNSFLIERICEPQICEDPPYTSKCWEEYRPQMLRFPGTIIIKAVKN